MTRTEIQEFKRFLHVRELFGMFSQYYRQNHLTSNPPTLEAYLEKAKPPDRTLRPQSRKGVFPDRHRGAGRDEGLFVVYVTKVRKKIKDMAENSKQVKKYGKNC